MIELFITNSNPLPKIVSLILPESKKETSWVFCSYTKEAYDYLYSNYSIHEYIDNLKSTGISVKVYILGKDESKTDLSETEFNTIIENGKLPSPTQNDYDKGHRLVYGFTDSNEAISFQSLYSGEKFTITFNSDIVYDMQFYKKEIFKNWLNTKFSSCNWWSYDENSLSLGFRNKFDYDRCITYYGDYVIDSR